MRKRKWIKLVSSVLVPVMLLTLMPAGAFAQKSSGNNLVKRMTSSVAMAHYKNSYDAFITEIQLTMKELSVINKRLGGDLESSEEVKDRLKIIKTLSGKTTVLKSDLKKVKNVARIMSGIPQVRKPMNLLKDSADSSMDKLKDFEKQIKPFYKKVTTFKQRVLLKGLTIRYTLVKQIKKAQKIFKQELFDKAKQIDNHINAAAGCLDVEKDLSDVSNALDKLTASIALFRKALETINNTTLKTVSLLKKIKIALKPFKAIKADLRVLDKILSKIRKALKAIAKALKKKIKIKFRYKPPIFKAIKFKISINLNKILQGPSVFFKFIEKKLGRFLWKVAKALGLKKIIKKFINKAKSLIKELLKKFHLNLDPDLKGLNKIGKITANLENLFRKLGDIYTLPMIKYPKRPDFDIYFAYLPRFKKLALCKQLKEADLAVNMLKIKGTAAQDHESTVAVEVTNHQDVGVLDLMKTTPNFDLSMYDHKGLLTLESDAGYRYQTEEFLVKAGKTKTIQVPWIPKGHGQTQLTATVSIVDINEKNLDNNTKQTSVDVLPPSVDLAVQSIAFEEKVTENQPSVIEVKIANLNDNYSAKATLDFSIDDGFTFKSDEIVLDAQADAIIDIKWTPGKSGKFKADAKITSAENRRDPKEKNNSIQESVTVSSQSIDLAIEDFIKADEIYPGVETELKVKVKNNGPKATDKTAKLSIKGDDGYKNESPINLSPHESKEIVYKWTPKKYGPVQFDIELASDIEDLDIENNSLFETVDVKPRTPDEIKAYEELLAALPIPEESIEDLFRYYNDLLEAGEKLQDTLQTPEGIEDVKRSLKELLEKLKTDYSRGNKASLMQLFSRSFPDYAQLIHAFQDDFLFFRNMNLNYRIDALNVAPDEDSAIAKVYWEISFMMRSGKFYRKTAHMSMRFVKEGNEWKIDGLVGNEIFGASLLSSVDLSLLLSGLNVGVAGTNITITGIVVRNKGNALAQNFRVRFIYKRLTGQRYTAYTTIYSLRAGSQTTLSCTIPAAFFIPGAGDTLNIEIDPDKNIPEIKVNNNVQTERFPF